MSTKFDSMFVLVGREPGTDNELRRVVAVRYGRNGGATAWAYHSEERLAHVSGGGWDLTAGALEGAARRLFATERFDGAAGYNALVRHLEGQGVRLATIGEAMWSVPAAGQAHRQPELLRFDVAWWSQEGETRFVRRTGYVEAENESAARQAWIDLNVYEDEVDTVVDSDSITYPLGIETIEEHDS